MCSVILLETLVGISKYRPKQRLGTRAYRDLLLEPQIVIRVYADDTLDKIETGYLEKIIQTCIDISFQRF